MALQRMQEGLAEMAGADNYNPFRRYWLMDDEAVEGCHNPFRRYHANPPEDEQVVSVAPGELQEQLAPSVPPAPSDVKKKVMPNKRRRRWELPDVFGRCTKPGIKGRLVKKREDIEVYSSEQVEKPISSFEESGLDVLMLNKIKESGIDLMACTQPGLGKTKAFILPLLNKLLENGSVQNGNPRAIVVSSTRESVTKIYNEVQKVWWPLRTEQTTSLTENGWRSTMCVL